MVNRRFEALFGEPVRAPEGPLTPFHMDLASSIQAVTDEIVLRLTRSLASETRERNLCLAGGVALNCVTNGKILRDGRFDGVWVQPAAGDAGGALGAALAAHHIEFGQERKLPHDRDGMRGSFLGPGYSETDIEHRLTAAGAQFEVLSEPDVLDAHRQSI
jgi:carbamoyltransferase